VGREQLTDDRSRLSGESHTVAPTLLGWTISHKTDAGTVTVALTEVEAYAGESDPASHAYRGRSPRNAVMFGPAGFLYCYFTYGMHWCCNVVTGPDGNASAVLLRAGRVIDGVDLARRRRGERVPDRALARGPANLAQALGLGREQNGADLLSGDAVRLSPGVVSGPVSSGPRVGVRLAHDVPWRFWITDDSTVSAYKRSPRATAS
jgi:DNA-3-methyladenine glycosylase